MSKGRPPELDERLQFIWRQFVDPCDAPISIWIEALWPALRNLLLEWFALDLKQILIAAYRPKAAFVGPRSRAHGRRAQKGKRGPFRTALGRAAEFDLNNEIGKRIDLISDIRGRGITPGLAFLWTIEGLIERVLFWWMVFDLLSEFLYEWTSLVSESIYCQARDDAVLLADGTGLITIPLVPWVGSIFNDTQKARNLIFWNGNGVVQGVGGGVISVQGTAHILAPGLSGTVGLRLRCVSGPNSGEISEAIVDAVVGQDVEVSAFANVAAGDGWLVEDQSTNAYFQFSALNLYLQAKAPPPK